MNVTPENIQSLKENEVFLFGSNRAGRHGAGAARLALNKFGAVYGEGEGLFGQSYALPTKDENIQTLPLEEIAGHIATFLKFARENSNLTFYVTQIGCGLAGLKPIDVAIFFGADVPKNVYLPQAFWDVINYDTYFFEIEKVESFKDDLGENTALTGFGYPPIMGNRFSCIRTSNGAGHHLGLFTTTEIQKIDYFDEGYVITTRNSVYKILRHDKNSQKANFHLEKIEKSIYGAMF